ncbi:MAG: type II secretion system F family protein [Bradyrhizobiaceae bacterium]|nr:type II secretion system F family protein [Bradyrhizobiaceae bacterium]
MSAFRYRAVTASGEVVTGEVDAPSRQEVIKRIEYLGHLAIEVEAATASMLVRKNPFRGRTPDRREVTIFLRQLAVLVGAGLTLETALQALGEDTSKALAWFCGALRSSISAGESFADALRRHTTLVEPAHVAMVRAGEASGTLDAVLRAIVEDRTRRELLAERVGAAVRYPLFLVGSAAVILLFFLIYVVPQFEPVFKDLGGKLNAGAAFVIAASTWLHTNLDVFFATCIVIVLATWLVLSRQATRKVIAAGFASMPGISGLIGDRRTARIVGTLGLLVENGVALPTALKIVRDIITEPKYAAAAERVHEQVRSGRRFSDALAETNLLPPLAVRMLRIGDEMGDLGSIARHATQYYEHKFGIGLDRVMGAIGPITIILVSTVIGALIVSIMTALLSITELAT